MQCESGWPRLVCHDRMESNRRRGVPLVRREASRRDRTRTGHGGRATPDGRHARIRITNNMNAPAQFLADAERAEGAALMAFMRAPSTQIAGRLGASLFNEAGAVAAFVP